MWNDKILSLLENSNSKAINSNISVWTRGGILSSALTQIPFFYLVNEGNWGNREIVWKDTKSIFQRRFHVRRKRRSIGP